MSLAGKGAVAIWHDIAPEGRKDFYDWHGREHMLERVGIPGFRRGRRFIALEADLEFFNLYETEGPETVTSPAYRERLDNPSDWTKATVPHFRKVARSLCRVQTSLGAGQGGLIATWRYDVPDALAAGHAETLSSRVLPEIATKGEIAGAHLLVADRGASAVANAEEKARGEKNRVPGCVLALEGWGDAAAFQAFCAEAISPSILRSAGAEGEIEIGLYQHQLTIDKGDVAAAEAQAAAVGS